MQTCPRPRDAQPHKTQDINSQFQCRLIQFQLYFQKQGIEKEIESRKSRLPLNSASVSHVWYCVSIHGYVAWYCGGAVGDYLIHIVILQICTKTTNTNTFYKYVTTMERESRSRKSTLPWLHTSVFVSGFVSMYIAGYSGPQYHATLYGGVVWE